jgi:mono/diheme cytochrome c family protein
MKRVAKWLGIGLAGLVGLLIVAAIGIFLVSGYMLGRTHEAKAETLARPTAQLLADAPRQARLQGCLNCHGEGLRGRIMIDAPIFAKLTAPNLTEVAARATDQQLAAAIRQGIGHDGRALFIMPSPQYSRMSDGEVAALIAFIRSQPRVEGNTGGFKPGPIGRALVATGGLPPVLAKMEEYRTKAPIHLGPAHAAGQRLAANGCSDCHGPALEGQTMDDGSAAPNLSIAGAYDYDQFRTLLRTGQTPGNKKLGLMKEVAEKDFVHLKDAEIKALHDYLRARAEKLGG